MPDTPNEQPAPPNPKAIAARAAALPDDALLAECDVEVYTAGGPGGQHRNKTESGVRLHHLPTGIRVGATERRSQLQNRIVALQRLREKLLARAATRAPRRKTKPTASSRRRRVEAKRLHGGKKRDRKQLD